MAPNSIASHNPLSERKTASDYAEDLENEASDKPSRWEFIRKHVAEVIALKSSLSGSLPSVGTTNELQSGLRSSVRGNLLSKKYLHKRTQSTGVAAYGQPGLPGISADVSSGVSVQHRVINHDDTKGVTFAATRALQAERDRFAARERAREKASRTAQRVQSEAIAIVDRLGGSPLVQNRRWTFAMCTLAKVSLSLLY